MTTAAVLAAYAPRYAALLCDTISARCIATGPEYLRLDADAVAVAAVVAYLSDVSTGRAIIYAGWYCRRIDNGWIGVTDLTVLDACVVTAEEFTAQVARNESRAAA
jgi:hypothetical protein